MNFSRLIFMIVIVIIGLFIQQEGNLKVVDIPNPLMIRVTGQNYEWHFHYPGLDNQFDTEDDIHTTRNLHIPIDTKIQLLLNSKDYAYFFSVPELNQIEIAMPKKEHTLQFLVKHSTKHKIKGDQMCGYSHESLNGLMIFEKPNYYQNWLLKKSDQ